MKYKIKEIETIDIIGYLLIIGLIIVSIYGIINIIISKRIDIELLKKGNYDIHTYCLEYNNQYYCEIK